MMKRYQTLNYIKPRTVHNHVPKEQLENFKNLKLLKNVYQLQIC